MNNSLKKRLDKLERQRTQLLNLISSLSKEEMSIHPEGKWSIAQVLSHLISSEHLSVNYLNKKILGINKTPNTGLTEEVKMIVLIISQRLPIKFKAPKILAENTTIYETADELKEAWEKVRNELRKVLERFEHDQLKRKIYKHPIAGMLNIQQMLQFFGEHINHHTPQVKNLLRQK